MAEKMRVHILAKKLNVSSKAILEKCRAEGLGNIVKNHMSTLSAGLDATIREWFSEGVHETAVETAERVDLKKVRRPRRKKQVDESAAGVGTGVETQVVDDQLQDDEGELAGAADDGDDDALHEPEVSAGDEPAAAPVVAEAAAEAASAVEPAAAPPSPTVTPAEPVTAAETPAEQPAAQPTAVEAPTSTVAAAAEAPAEQPVSAELSPTVAAGDADAPAAGDGPAAEAIGAAPAEAALASGDDTAEPAQPKEPVQAAGPQHVPAPAKLRGPRVVRYETPEPDTYYRRPPPRRPAPRGEGPPPDRPDVGAPPAPAPESPDAKTDRKTKPKTSPRRAQGREAEAGERLAEWRDQDLIERRQRLAGATGRRHRRRSDHGGGGRSGQTVPSQKTKAMLTEPVQLKAFCSATGLNFLQLFKVLQHEHNIIANINMTIPNEVAELLALNFGVEVEIIPAKSKLDTLREEYAARPRETLRPRPPVVTMLGHVDHGKTSLLDAIRASEVAKGEDGGITQHIGASCLETPHGTFTFLDTPGHAAFTAMRLRGAQLTDVVVLVVAADDGIMPQTVEAINHAKAAEVAILVALTKIDLGDQNLMKIYGQLAEHELTPSGDWGGEIDVIPTSVVTGSGIDNLLENITAMGELLELKADPTLPAMGHVIEAETKEGVGAVARILVREGTLQVGDTVVCGGAFGKVRALLNHRGERIEQAGPGVPVEVWGLDDVPAAGDQLFGVDSVQVAKDVATEVKQERVESGRLQSQKVRTLEEMFQRRDTEEIPELNIIIKADVDGSLAALRQTLMDLPTDEVRLTIRHAGVGAVNDSDVQLAGACDGIVVAFRVDAGVGARRLAEQQGVDIRHYRVIYDVADEIKKALEGLLAPEQRIEHRGSAEVRGVFHISKLGVVAGCYVTDGSVDRNHRAKVIRDGVVVREGCRFASVRRFKDDVKEVRSGMECGLRLENFEDVHVGDIIETYEIVEIARTL